MDIRSGYPIKVCYTVTASTARAAGSNLVRDSVLAAVSRALNLFTLVDNSHLFNLSFYYKCFW